jgi:hypothetical protein
MRDDVIEDGSGVHNEEHCNMYFSPRRVARMGSRGRHAGFWRESQKERGHMEDLDIDL